MKRCALLFSLLISLVSPVAAQVITADQPVVYSQTVIAIVPGSTVPKAISQSPELQSPAQEEQEEPAEQPEEAESATADIKDSLATQAKQPARMTLRVEVRGAQIPVNSGIFPHYKLDAEHGVLTYYPEAKPRRMIAENIQKPLDVMFIGDDGIIRQIIPEVAPAFIPDDIRTGFSVRALLYMQAGQAAQWAIQPGYRIEHGLFTPKPLIYTAPEEE